jgi:hypothetical protein
MITNNAADAAKMALPVKRAGPAPPIPQVTAKPLQA